MEIFNLARIKKKKEPSCNDSGLGCCHRVLTKETTMYCRLNGFRSKNDCKNCKDKNKF